MTSPDCQQCPLRKITITWRPSATYMGSYAGYVHSAKVCAISPRPDDTWNCKVFLAFANGFAEAERPSRAQAERWCTETVQQWFAQLDHD